MNLAPRLAALGLLAIAPASALAADKEPSDVPRPVAATRPELKQLLEASKKSEPRLPLPPPSEEEIAQAKARANGPGAPGLHGIINNGRMRKIYLPAEFVSGGFQREPDPAMTLSSAFKTEFFWIVSRANNCTYCQGHQEVKLAAEGLSEDTIAALDGDWSEFTPAERAAFAFTRKLTFEPQSVGDADVAALRAFYNDAQILEIMLTVAGNNAMNRWTGALAIPQEDNREFLTPTAEKFRTARTRLAPIGPDDVAKPGAPLCARPVDRGASPTRAEVEAALAACRNRTPRLALPDESKARAVLSQDGASTPLPQWERLLATFPKFGPSRVAMHLATEQKGKLSKTLNAQIAWVCAREDRAWYALGHARERLRALGASEDALYAADAPLPAGDRLALAFARKLTVNPALISDADVAGLRKHFSDHEVAEIVFQATEAAFFDRLTEAAGLKLD